MEYDHRLNFAKTLLKEKEDENAKLREALKEIAEHGGINMLGKTCAEVARKALWL